MIMGKGNTSNIIDFIVVWYRFNAGIYDDDDDDDDEIIFTSNPRDQPRVIILDDAFENDTFEKWKQCVVNHPWIGESELSDGFTKTKGLLMSWNLNGVSELHSYPELKCMAEYFDALRHPGTNAYVMNILVCDRPKAGPDEIAVDVHLDDTVNTNNDTHRFIAHEVSVLYMQLPQDMKAVA